MKNQKNLNFFLEILDANIGGKMFQNFVEKEFELWKQGDRAANQTAENDVENAKKIGKYKRIQNPIRFMLMLRGHVQEVVQIWKEMLCSARDFAKSLETYCEVKERDYESFDAEADQEEDIMI